jgi:hypothetical protein
MTQNAPFADDEATDPQAAPGFVTQIFALASAACVGVALFFGSVLVGVALFFVVLVGMNVDAGTRWVVKLRETAERRDCRVLRHVLSPQ